MNTTHRLIFLIFWWCKKWWWTWWNRRCSYIIYLSLYWILRCCCCWLCFNLFCGLIDFYFLFSMKKKKTQHDFLLTTRTSFRQIFMIVTWKLSIDKQAQTADQSRRNTLSFKIENQFVTHSLFSPLKRGKHRKDLRFPHLLSLVVCCLLNLLCFSFEKHYIR